MSTPQVGRKKRHLKQLLRVSYRQAAKEGSHIQMAAEVGGLGPMK